MFINIKNSEGVETVDELPTATKEQRKEFKRVLNEYNWSDSYNNYYSSQRCTKEWRKR